MTKNSIINGKYAELAMLLGMAFSVFCAGFCGFAEDYRDITQTVFRLHILANSDSEEDQSLKLKVRDAVLEENSDIFEDCKSAEEAAAAAREHIDEIKSSAEKVLAENGAGYGAECGIAKMRFDDRVYGDMTMPAGEYLALRVTLGDAEGKNWWRKYFLLKSWIFSRTVKATNADFIFLSCWKNLETKSRYSAFLIHKKLKMRCFFPAFSFQLFREF